MNNAIEKELLETGVLVLRLNRPEVLNAMNRDLIVGLLDNINETVHDEKVRSIVLTGNGRGFCAGADLVDGGWPNEDNLSAGQSAGKNMENPSCGHHDIIYKLYYVAKLAGGTRRPYQRVWTSSIGPIKSCIQNGFDQSVQEIS